MFASALQNFGVAQLLDLLLELAPAPSATEGVDGSVRQVEDEFSAFVFKVQSGMNASHRDRLAYARVVSGVFERGMVVTHASTGRPFATKFAQTVFGRETTSVEQASPGDIIGLVNAQALRVGDTIYEGDADRVPAGAEVRARALHDGQRQGHRPLQAVPQGHRAARPGRRRPGAPLRPARRPEPGARSRRPAAVRGRRGADGQRVQLPDPALPARLQGGPAYRCRRRRRRWAASAAPRCCSAATAPTWRSSPTSGAPTTLPASNPDVLLEELPAGGS